MPLPNRTGPDGGSGPAPDTLAVGASGVALSLRDPSDNGDAWGSGIFDHHRKMLQASGITASHARARGYRSIDSGNRKRLAEIGIVKAVRGSDGLLIPLLRLDGEVGGYQFRPDNPRVKDGKEIKYETPWKQPNCSTSRPESLNG